MSNAIVYLIPSLLSDEGIKHIPPAVLEAAESCSVFFVENERTARRFLKKIIPSFDIDAREWYVIHKRESEALIEFKKSLQKNLTIGILSEAGCPGIADPGQILVEKAQQEGAVVKPITGPSSILLALMASGLNGQQFHFHGYLPVNANERARAIRELEAESARTGCTQIFIETPYRNNQVLDTIISHCKPSTRLCLAVNITASSEIVKTMKLSMWKQQRPDLHKQPVIFLIQS